MYKFIRTPDINGIVAIDSSPAGSSSVTRGSQSIVSPARSSSAPKGNQSTVTPVGSSSVARGNKPSESTVSPTKSSSVPRGNQSIVSPARSSSAPKGNQSIVSPARSSSAPKGNQSTVSPAKSSSASRGNGSPGLGTQAVRGVKKIFGVRAEDSKEKKPKKSRVLFEKPTPMRPLRSAQTMTIEKIQQRLNSLIKGDFPIRLIGLISANHETINKEINSDNNKIIDLVDKAANVKATSKGKTAYQMAEDKDNEEFLEVKDNEEFLKVVDNARAKLEEAKKQEKKEVVDNAREKKKSSSVSQKADANLPQKQQIVPQSVAPRLVNLDRSKSRTLNDLTIEEVQQKLENAIKDKEISSVINLISDNHETIKKSIEKSGDTDFMELILQAAHCVKDESMGKTASNLAKEQNNLIFLDVIRNVFKKLCELNSRLYQLDPESALNRQKSFYKLTYIPEIEEMHEKQEMRSVKSCSDLTTLGSAPSVEEGGKNNEEETPVDVKPIGGKNTGLVWFDGNGLQSSGDENAFNSIFKIVNPEKKPLNLSLSPVRPSTDQDLHESDSDDSGMGGSPVSSPKKEGMESPQSSRRNGISSSIESLNSGDAEEISGPQEEKKIEPKLQEEFLPAAKLLPLLNKERPKGPSGRRASSRRLRNHEDRTQEPTPVVTPVLEAGTQEEQDRLIPVSATQITLISPEEKNILLVKQEPAASRNSDKNILLKKQSNNRNVCFAAIAICTLGAASCFAIAGSMSAKNTPALATPPVVAIALCVIGIVFVIAAATTWCLTPPPPSSELSPMGLTHQAAERKEVN